MQELLIGYVRSVRGLDVDVELNKHIEIMKFPINGKIYRVGQIGSYVVIPLPFEKLVGIVSEVKMQPIEETKEGKLVLSDKKMMLVQLVGSIRGETFNRGLKTYPLIGDEVHLANLNDIDKIFSGQRTEFSIEIGNFSQTEDTPVWIDVNKLLSRHSVIIGNTGAGKSTTVATIIKKFLDKYDNAHIILFDIHGEYKYINHDKIKHISSDELKIPHWLLNFSQWMNLLSISTSASKQIEHLKSAIIELKEEYNKDFDKNKLSVDSPIFFPIEEMLEKKQIRDDASLYEKLDVLFKDSRYDNILKSGIDSTSHITDFVENIIDKDFCCTTLDLSRIVPDLLSSVIEILSRIFYEFCYWNVRRDFPILLIYEEGHRYLSHEDYTSRKRIENISKEGRKCGLGIIIVSQRPSEISETVLAQCNNFIAHRLTTDKDKDFVKNLLPENLIGLTNLLPSLYQGEALIAGDAIVLPARVDIEKTEDLSSTDCDFNLKWTEGPDENFNVESIISGWINQEFNNKNNNQSK
ncbi:MAG TPA: DUF853 family protein [Candidatus Atribacteria bacterium]|nr:DUF853 family protein [Candidatus Atribacteria bacterium]